jgi:hypothetical protein
LGRFNAWYPRDRFIQRLVQGFLTRLSALSDEVRMSYDPKSTQDQQLVGQQLALARQSSSTTIYVLPIAAALISVANRDWVPVERMVAWTLLVTAACFGTEFYYRWLMRRIDDGSRKASRYAPGTMSGRR